MEEGEIAEEEERLRRQQRHGPSPSTVDPFASVGLRGGGQSVLLEIEKSQIRREVIARVLLHLDRYRRFLEDEIDRALEAEQGMRAWLLDYAATPTIPSYGNATEIVADKRRRRVESDGAEPLENPRSGTKRKVDDPSRTPFLFPQPSPKDRACSTALPEAEHGSIAAVKNSNTVQTNTTSNAALPTRLEDHQVKIKQAEVDVIPDSRLIEANTSVIEPMDQYSRKRPHGWCKLCNLVLCIEEQELLVHLKGKKHKARLARHWAESHCATSGISTLDANKANGNDLDGLV